MRKTLQKIGSAISLASALAGTAHAQDAIKTDVRIGYNAPSRFTAELFSNGILSFGDGTLDVGFSGLTFNPLTDITLTGYTLTDITNLVEVIRIPNLIRLQNLGEALFKEGCALGSCTTIDNTSTYALNNMPVDLSVEAALTFYTNNETFLRMQALRNRTDLRTRSSISGENTSIDKPFQDLFTLNGIVSENANVTNTLSVEGMYEQKLRRPISFLRLRTLGMGYNLQHQEDSSIRENIHLTSDAQTHALTHDFFTSTVALTLDETSHTVNTDILGLPVYAVLQTADEQLELFVQAQQSIRGGSVKDRAHSQVSTSTAVARLTDILFAPDTLYETENTTNSTSKKKNNKFDTHTDYGARIAYTLPAGQFTLIPYVSGHYNEKKTFEAGSFVGIDTRVGSIAGSIHGHYSSGSPLTEERKDFDFVLIPWSKHTTPGRQWAAYLSEEQLNSTRFLFSDIQDDIAQQTLFQTPQAYVRIGANTDNRLRTVTGITNGQIGGELTCILDGGTTVFGVRGLFPNGIIGSATYTTSTNTKSSSRQEIGMGITLPLP